MSYFVFCQHGCGRVPDERAFFSTRQEAQECIQAHAQATGHNHVICVGYRDYYHYRLECENCCFVRKNGRHGSLVSLRQIHLYRHPEHRFLPIKLVQGRR